MDNIDLIGDTVSVRQESKVQNDERGLPIPDLHRGPRLFLMDELKDQYNSAVARDDEEMAIPKADRGNYARSFKRSVQKGLEVGRGLKVRVIFSTVTDESSDFGFKNNVFKQSATIYLGNQAVTALDSNYLLSITPEKKAQLKLEFKARQEAGQTYIALFYNGSTNEVFYFDAEGIADIRADQNQQADEFSKTAMSSTDDRVDQSAKSAITESDQPGRKQTDGPTAGQHLPTLVQVLTDGVDCPHCGTKTTEQRGKSIDSKNRIRMVCSKGKNNGCKVDTFRLKVR